jgi:predicted esterase
MNQKEHLVKIERTARYFTLGNLTPQTQTIWFVFHGYGQLASFFIKKFDGIVDQNTFLVAPEGISRFYLDEKYQRVGASWTTREHNDLESREYIDFINGVYHNLIDSSIHSNIKINVLGFSQGCATALRWLNSCDFIPDKLILWAGFFNKGISGLIDPQKLKAVDTYYVYGLQDEFLIQYPDMTEAFKEKMKEEINPKIISFEGKHRVDEVQLKALIDSW